MTSSWVVVYSGYVLMPSVRLTWCDGESKQASLSNGLSTLLPRLLGLQRLNHSYPSLYNTSPYAYQVSFCVWYQPEGDGRCYNVMFSFIGWVYTQNDPSCNVVSHLLSPYQEWPLHIYHVERLRSLFMNVVGGCYQSCRPGDTHGGVGAAICHKQFIYWWGLSG